VRAYRRAPTTNQTAELQQACAQAAAKQAQINKMQAENKWVVAGDVLFPEGGYQLTPAGQRRSVNMSPTAKSAERQGRHLWVHG
jgi:hypothetical protein